MADDGLPRLLTPDEPAPFELVNPAGRTRALLTCDHSSRYIPRALDNLGLDEAVLLRHIAWDIGAADVTRQLSRLLDAPALLCGFSRLVIDPNRKPGSDSSVPGESDGVDVPGNWDLGPAEIDIRVQQLFEPYHQALGAQLAAMRSAAGPPVVIALHSFTPVMDGVERPWEVGILWNRDPRLPLPLIARLRAMGLSVGDNEPYSGRDFHGYSMQSHADGTGLANVLIELRQDLVDTHQGAETWSKILADVLTGLLRDPALYQIQSP